MVIFQLWGAYIICSTLKILGCSVFGGVFMVGGLYSVLWGKITESRTDEGQRILEEEKVCNEEKKTASYPRPHVWLINLQDPIKTSHYSLEKISFSVFFCCYFTSSFLILYVLASHLYLKVYGVWWCCASMLWIIYHLLYMINEWEIEAKKYILLEYSCRNG